MDQMGRRQGGKGVITKQQAMSASAFHENHEPGAKVFRWRRNGATQTWKTRPSEFRVPVKYGIRSYGNITEVNASDFHTEEDCPDNA
jgi:hypothetical protein